MKIKLAEIVPKEIMPGYHGKLIHTQNMSLAFWEVEAGAKVPEHAHMNEQVMQVLEGKFEFTLDGITKTYEPGDLVIIPPHVPHSGLALTPCKLMDVFSPTREEYR
ncbi:Cupin domain-containing protein [Arenibacter algicola]|jgi:quercetin dioxygenase-like cupin family protein|uniref:Cupin domain-containing protein n=2 Tax=Arenibacter TaxID=178469 RepID=A0ABY3A4I6_9FLAO|nr:MULTISPECIES: cupin domain-containing protein [Arenibacter]GBF20508.1 cupin domain protein [Arenibacter sp. NBRC 103722]HCO84498.1 cupin domain-containing protein [Arenibacter sp.]|tara:strand:- start:8834 stop:9151 length:318 start_codon:yes stop_codon:yes gene_type:complete